MAVVYLDTSALVKLCVAEGGSALVAALWDGADLVVTSRLANAEVRAVLAGGRRAGRLDEVTAAEALAAWERLWPGLHVLELRESVTASAAVLVGRHPLRAADALHLASALELRSPDLVVAAWDEHLAAAARAEGLLVVP
ncbi:type II toxin-antitoxin system VapC family toxin [Cellulomonas sp. Leaf395]|uniref:type II toxin-antitoxin system VapC family toxin n=1 Tax=Cellulomonas sp. Leaf395 TaxID=1736362 RepID=UPI0006F85686|nr:type II toxin-antitoxin system VapC family toxin [Cellulomonas sp. Leaf395]KQS98825.1 twitching motility protein PilT [Cellulomonas sp. Leaf395]